jgi:glyoxylase-like metal-dependent hydrolase (beta-lactamase superfamily II)
MTTRRAFLWHSGMATAAALLARGGLAAQTPTEDPAVQPNPTLPDQLRTAAANETIRTTKLTDTIFLLQGVGGNIVCQVGPDGKVLIDSGISTGARLLLDALEKLDEHRLKLLINTHWHFDHTGGNECVNQAGASILAHENTRKRLSVDTRLEGWVYTFPAAPAGAIPTTVFEDEHTVHANGSTLALKHYSPAHTDSDISVHFTEADVLHTGDTFWNRNYPFVDYSTGGSIDGQIRAAEANLAKVTATTVVIPGHGAVGGKADLTLFRDVLVEAREKVAKLKKQGRTLEEVITAKPTAPYDAEWGQSFQSPKSFLGWVYQGV